MDTDKMKDLLTHFKDAGISHAPGNGLEKVLEFQDMIGHSTPDEIFQFESGLGREERRIFVWVTFSTLDMESAVNVLKWSLFRRMKRAYIDDVEEYLSKEEEGLQDKVDAARTAQDRLENSKKFIFRRISGLRKQVDRLTKQNENLESENQYLKEKVYKLRSDLSEYSQAASKWRDLKLMLAN